MIVDPICLGPHNTVREALDLMSHYHISGVPIVESDRLAGILTNRDIRFIEERDMDDPVSEWMTAAPLVTVPVGTTLEQAKEILRRHRDREAAGGGRRPGGCAG